MFQFRSGLVALRAADGTIDFAYNAHTSGGVEALAAQRQDAVRRGVDVAPLGTKLVPRRSKVKGRKLKPRKVPIYRYNLVALEAAGGDAVRAFAPRVNGSVNALALAGNRLYLAGGFETVGGRRRDGFAAVSPASGVAVDDVLSPAQAGGELDQRPADRWRARLCGGPLHRASAQSPWSHFAAFAGEAAGGAA